jgi:hypothetical protein
MGDRATHDDNRAHAPGKIWVEAEGESEIGERANGEQVDLSGHLAGEAQDLRNRIFSNRSALRCGLVRITETILAMHPLGGCQRLRHGSARAVGDGHIVKATEFEKPTGVDCGKVRRDVAMHAANSEQLNVAAPSEVEHGDRVIDPHVGVEQDFSAFHKGGVYGLRPPPACLMRA